MANTNRAHARHLTKALGNALAPHTELVFAYLHGSALETDHPNDIDVAVYFRDDHLKQAAAKGSVDLDVVIPLELSLERTLGKTTDVQLLNRSPLGFRYRVVNSGIVLLDRDPLAREQFELLARVEYFDFRPRVEEYLREAFS